MDESFIEISRQYIRDMTHKRKRELIEALIAENNKLRHTNALLRNQLGLIEADG